MTKQEKARELRDQDLDQVTGGGLMDSEAGTFGFEPITLERGVRQQPRSGVWKAPAGIE